MKDEQLSEVPEKYIWKLMPPGPMGIGGGNYVLRPSIGKEFSISYQPNRSLWGGGAFDCETDEGETAICNYRDDCYHILNGDFRKEYEAIIEQGLDACIEFYKTKKEEFGSSWSTD